MKYALKLLENGESSIIRADGTPLGNGDVSQKIFHILPKLFVPACYLNDIKKELVTLEVMSPSGLPVSPDGDITVRQPYPNDQYFVGGSNTIRNGWTILIPEELNSFDLIIKWKIRNAYSATFFDEWIIHHSLHIVLKNGTGNTFTMDLSCWPRTIDKEIRNVHFPIIPIGINNSNEDVLEGRDILRNEFFTTGGEEDDLHVSNGCLIEENVKIPGIKMDQAWSIDAFQEEQIHEFQHQTDFETGNEIHRNNSCIEMPPEVLINAIELAQTIPYGEDSAFELKLGACEDHPAILLICDWWNHNCPAKQKFLAAIPMLWVRLREDGEYWCGYYETPTDYIENFSDQKHCNANIGDNILISFLASQAYSTFDENGFNINFVDGSNYASVGLPEDSFKVGEYDEAWYALEALSLFPDRFPTTWRYLKDKISEN